LREPEVVEKDEEGISGMNINKEPTSPGEWYKGNEQ
jgi:hypothetical protein